MHNTAITVATQRAIQHNDYDGNSLALKATLVLIDKAVPGQTNRFLVDQWPTSSVVTHTGTSLTSARRKTKLNAEFPDQNVIIHDSHYHYVILTNNKIIYRLLKRSKKIAKNRQLIFFLNEFSIITTASNMFVLSSGCESAKKLHKFTILITKNYDSTKHPKLEKLKILKLFYN